MLTKRSKVLKGPPSPKRPCAPRLLFLFLSEDSFRTRFLRSHLVENRPKACRNLLFNYQAVVSCNYFVTEPAKRIFFALTSSNMFPAK